jgi:hypothetical protein
MARKPTDTVQLKLRFSEGLRRKLEREAKRNDQSLNSEIVSRLDQSFSDEGAEWLKAIYGGRTGDLFRALATAIWLIEKRTGKKWHENRTTCDAVEDAIHFILMAFITPVSAHFAYGWKRLIESRDERAAEMARELGEPPPHPELYRTAIAAALETLQKMDMAPSDAEIAEEGARLTGKRAPEKEGEK